MEADSGTNELISRLPAILFITFIFGGWTICSVVRSIADNWRKVRQSEQAAALKQNMIEKGMSADDIVRVLNADRATPGRRSGGDHDS